jgi:hypothetical protein
VFQGLFSGSGNCRILSKDDDTVIGNALDSGLSMGSQELLDGDSGVIDETIGGFDLSSATASRRELQRRFVAHSVHKQFESRVQAFVTQVGGPEFFFNPRLHNGGT